jgi:hypothetical protein
MGLSLISKPILMPNELFVGMHICPIYVVLACHVKFPTQIITIGKIL